MTINIRPMLKRDKPPLMQILRNTPEFKPVEVAVAEELIDGYLEDAVGYGYYVLIAESGSLLLGYICYGPTPHLDGSYTVFGLVVAGMEQVDRIKQGDRMQSVTIVEA